MNNRQKIVINQYLKDEKQIIKELKQNYQEALNNIDKIIADLLSRTDVQNIQSIIYQVDYQKALKAQITAFLDILNSNNFNKISEYITECYNNGFIGTLYDLQGQGVPLLFQINQDEVIKAIDVNSKLSKSLYDSLKIDINKLKKDIQSELSRGIAQSLGYQEIARNLKNISNGSYGRMVRIARTEGHRVQQEATFNCQLKAKAKGAKIMKQWDSTLDSRTRTTHQLLDGQTVEVDEPFKNDNGDEAMYPSGFGIASEDIHCRCVLIQKAKWLLNDAKFTKMNGETRELQHFENLNDYEKFKSEFWNWENK